MAGGGKGGSQTSKVQIPAWLETAAKQNLGRADEIAQIGYTPYMGPDVAAMQPGQIAAMQNTNNAASAFGMAAPVDVMAGMPQAQQFAGGVQGYSSFPLYQQSVDALAAARPGQYAAMNAPFIDPITGARPAYPFAAGGAQGGQAPGAGGGQQFVGMGWDGQPVYAPQNIGGTGSAEGAGGVSGLGGGMSMPGTGTGSLGLPDPFGGGGAFTGFDPGGLPGIAGTIGGALSGNGGSSGMGGGK